MANIGGEGGGQPESDSALFSEGISCTRCAV